MTKKLSFSRTFAVILVLVTFALAIGYYFYRTNSSLSTYRFPNQLAEVEFPREPVHYPANWPDELRFPSEFTPVDTASGTLPESTTGGWGVKLKYNGKPLDALSALTVFLDQNGWAVLESYERDSGGFSLLIEREGTSGIIVADPDLNDPATTLILITIFA